MKKTLTLLLTVIFIININAGQIDSTVIGPGVVHYHEFKAEGPWHLNILKIDLKNEWLSIETVKAHDRLKSHERTTSMASRKESHGHRIVCGTNGDFYAGDGSPIGTQIINGEILKSYNDWQTIGFDINKKPMIANVNFSGKLMIGDSINPVSGVNQVRQQDHLTLYNNFFGSSTGTNIYGAEALMVPLTEWKVNDTMTCVIESMREGQGNMSIPAGKFVLSAHGTSKAFMDNNFVAGDTVKMVLSMAPGLPQLQQMIGGNAKIVVDGAAVGSSGDRHPRTSIGYDRDSTTLYMFTVDGRRAGYSIGMTLRELSEYMVNWNVYQGLNLDGGGSTTMLARGEIKNRPSDPGGERSVSNAIFVVSSAPDGPLAHLRIKPREAFVASGASQQFTVKGLDQYYNYVTLSPGTVTWSCDPVLGTVTSNGHYTAADDTLTGYIYAQAGQIKDSVLVRMTRLESITLQPNPVILEVGENQQMIPIARDNYNNIVTVANGDYTWSVTGDVGTISTTGLFSSTTEGNGSIIAEYNGVQGSVPVTVGVPTAVIIDNFTNMNNFSISGVNINNSGCSFTADGAQFISSPSSGKLVYDLTTGGTSALYMNCSIPVSGTPDKVGIHVFGDGKQHWLRGEFNDADNEKFIVDFTASDPGINWNGTWQYLEVNMDDAAASWANPSAVLDFPITWKKIYLVETDDSKKDQGVIYLDDFQVDFITTDIKTEMGSLPTEFKLGQNYPNPFNPATTINYSLPEAAEVKLSIFDLLGREVKILVQENKSAGNYNVVFDAHNIPSGVYFYKLQAGDFVESKKMILLK